MTIADDVRPAVFDRLPEGFSVTTVSRTVELTVDTLPGGLRLLAAGGPAVFLLSVAVGGWLLAGVLRGGALQHDIDGLV